MFEGKELEGKIGSVGSYSADVNGQGVIELSVGVKIDLIAELEKLALKTQTPIDDQAIAWVKKLLAP